MLQQSKGVLQERGRCGILERGESSAAEVQREAPGQQLCKRLSEQLGKLDKVEEGHLQEKLNETDRSTSRIDFVGNCIEKHFTKLVECVGRFGCSFKEN